MEPLIKATPSVGTLSLVRKLRCVPNVLFCNWCPPKFLSPLTPLHESVSVVRGSMAKAQPPVSFIMMFTDCTICVDSSKFIFPPFVIEPQFQFQQTKEQSNSHFNEKSLVHGPVYGPVHSPQSRFCVHVQCFQPSLSLLLHFLLKLWKICLVYDSLQCRSP